MTDKMKKVAAFTTLLWTSFSGLSPQENYNFFNEKTTPTFTDSKEKVESNATDRSPTRKKPAQKPAINQIVRRPVNFILNDGRTIKGFIPLFIQTIQFKIEKDGQLFEREVKLTEIQAIEFGDIECLRTRRSQRGDYAVYEYLFAPVEAKITLIKDESFEAAIDPFDWLYFRVEVQKGITVIKNYVIDSYIPKAGNGKEEYAWRKAKTADPKYYKNVKKRSDLKKIVFMEKDSAAQN